MCWGTFERAWRMRLGWDRDSKFYTPIDYGLHPRFSPDFGRTRRDRRRGCGHSAARVFSAVRHANRVTLFWGRRRARGRGSAKRPSYQSVITFSTDPHESLGFDRAPPAFFLAFSRFFGGFPSGSLCLFHRKLRARAPQSLFRQTGPLLVTSRLLPRKCHGCGTRSRFVYRPPGRLRRGDEACSVTGALAARN